MASFLLGDPTLIAHDYTQNWPGERGYELGLFVADDWRATLDATDYAARKLLDPAQTGAWDVARFVERRILWPWLPEP